MIVQAVSTQATPTRPETASTATRPQSDRVSEVRNVSPATTSGSSKGVKVGGATPGAAAAGGDRRRSFCHARRCSRRCRGWSNHTGRRDRKQNRRGVREQGAGGGNTGAGKRRLLAYGFACNRRHHADAQRNPWPWERSPVLSAGTFLAGAGGGSSVNTHPSGGAIRTILPHLGHSRISPMASLFRTASRARHVVQETENSGFSTVPPQPT